MFVVTHYEDEYNCHRFACFDTLEEARKEFEKAAEVNIYDYYLAENIWASDEFKTNFEKFYKEGLKKGCLNLFEFYDEYGYDYTYGDILELKEVVPSKWEDC